MSSEECTVNDGDFGAEVRGHTLYLPPLVMKFARLFGVNDSDELLQSVAHFHGSLRAQLGWDEGEHQQATRKLLEQLNGHTSGKVQELLLAILDQE